MKLHHRDTENPQRHRDSVALCDLSVSVVKLLSSTASLEDIERV